MGEVRSLPPEAASHAGLLPSPATEEGRGIETPRRPPASGRGIALSFSRLFVCFVDYFMPFFALNSAMYFSGLSLKASAQPEQQTQNVSPL